MGGMGLLHGTVLGPIPFQLRSLRAVLSGSVTAEPVLPGAAVANPDLGERTFLTYLTAKARAPRGHPLRWLAGKAPGCWGHPSGVLQGGTSRMSRQALFQDAVPGVARACCSSGHPALGPAGTALTRPQHGRLSSCTAWVPQLQVTPPLFGDMSTMCCTSPGSLNHQPSRAFSGEESSLLAKCRPEAKPVPAQ